MKSDVQQDELREFARRFVERGSMHGVAVQAILDVRPNLRRSRKTARETASRWLKEPVVVNEIDAHRREIRDKYTKDHEHLANHMAQALNASIADMYDESGQILPPNEWDDALRLSVKKFKETTKPDGTTVLEIELRDKEALAKMLGEHIGFFATNNEQQRPVITGVNVKVHRGT